MAAIEVENLTKEFNRFVAVDHISFSIKKEKLLACLAPMGQVRRPQCPCFQPC